MSRSVAWRRNCSDVVHWRQVQAMQARLYVLQESGPTAFILREQDSPKKLRVSLGDPSTCSCSTFLKERELCVHILWVVLRVFRIPAENPISWQGGLNEREVGQLVRSRERSRTLRATTPTLNTSNTNSDTEQGTVEPRPIEEGDNCPICQDDMTSTQQLTYCRYSCGHSIHSKCMKVWADHQLSQGSKIKCPMCRADFGTLKMIMTDHLKKTAFRRDVHPGTRCNHCNTTPIAGKHYVCTICDQYSLCMKCFSTPTHNEHPFQFREKSSHRWRPAVRDLTQITPALANELQGREISEGDYDTLLALDAPSGTGGLTSKELAGLKSIMLNKNSAMLKQREVHCGLCLAGYVISQHVVELPCTHRFHKVCAENWLSHTHDYCPICNETVVVALPTRKRVPTRRYNTKKEEETIQETIEFSLAGNSVVTSSNTMETTMTTGVTSQDQGSRGIISGRQRSRPPQQPNNMNPVGLFVGATASPPDTPPRPPPGPGTKRRNKLPVLNRPTSGSSSPDQLSSTMLEGLRIGGGSNSPVDIVRRISSVHDRRPARRHSRGSRDQPAVTTQPDLVQISGTAIS
eukprot:sb/3463405/